MLVRKTAFLQLEGCCVPGTHGEVVRGRRGGDLGLLPDAEPHLIVVPASEQGLRRAMGEAHRRYTRRINFREKWRGYLWQGRFASFVMDEPYLLAAARYAELNPVRARLAQSAAEWRWSSARAHLTCRGMTTAW